MSSEPRQVGAGGNAGNQSAIKVIRGLVRSIAPRVCRRVTLSVPMVSVPWDLLTEKALIT